LIPSSPSLPLPSSYYSVRRAGFALLKTQGGYKGGTATKGGFRTVTGSTQVRMQDALCQ
jgi:hypothetical protein